MAVFGRLSLRARLTVAATAMAAVGLAISGVLLLIALDRALLTALDETARRQGDDIATLVESGRLPDPLPGFGVAVAQVLDADDRVIASTPGGDRLTPVVAGDDLAAVRSGAAIDLDGTRLGQPEPLRVVGIPTDTAGDPRTVVVAVSLEEQQRSVRFAKIGVFGGGLAITAALALLSWLVIVRALRPVDRLRGGAEEISGAGGGHRLPVPAGGDELSRLATTLNDMLRRLDAAAARQRAFVADAAHELRSPIAALRTELEVALAHPDAVDPHDTAREALVEVQRMARLVDDLLVLAHLDNPRPLRRDELVDLGQLALEVTEGVRDGRVRVRVDSGGDVFTRGHRDSLSRVLRNLVDNAVRHASSQVTVAVSGDGGAARVSVADDGAGVAPADRERIFERFARLDAARDRDAGGTGLGLAIAREIVVSHGGTVVVEDAGPGARFVVTLPPARATIGAPEAVS
ncbi:cell wall metabolism sensor histidine kinase WalK [Jiangella sp. DSM 45060]|uniref:sensor histidine kinase n=1 Tax=Jiangella sp. DSM 45060 TaxID=1798224 RepID=UPI00087A3517|nr:ATP-binding protein [Jiangella sp. DSM 45060]SDS93159.1 Signal transduction histidine kinase [Jiangella sp. DSM 45060]